MTQQTSEHGGSSTGLNEFLEKVKNRLMPTVDYRESESVYLLRCPAGACGDEPNFILDRHDGSGFCNCGRTGASSYSPEQLAREVIEILQCSFSRTAPQVQLHRIRHQLEDETHQLRLAACSLFREMCVEAVVFYQSGRDNQVERLEEVGLSSDARVLGKSS